MILTHTARRENFRVCPHCDTEFVPVNKKQRQCADCIQIEKQYNELTEANISAAVGSIERYTEMILGYLRATQNIDNVTRYSDEYTIGEYQEEAE